MDDDDDDPLPHSQLTIGTSSTELLCFQHVLVSYMIFERMEQINCMETKAKHFSWVCPYLCNLNEQVFSIQNINYYSLHIFKSPER